MVGPGGEPPKTKIFVGRLPEDAKAPDLRKLFEQFGSVTECDILNRYGFVHMETEEMAARAIAELNNADFMGTKISVEQSTGKKGGRGGGGPMRGGGGRGMRKSMGRGGMGGGRPGRGRPSGPYGRPEPRGDYERRGPPMRNGYGGGGYDGYDRGNGQAGYDSYYGGAGRMPPPQPMMPPRDRPMWPRETDRRPGPPDAMRGMGYDRRPPPTAYPDMTRGGAYDTRAPPAASYDRRGPYEARAPDMYARRSPPPTQQYMGSGYDRPAAGGDMYNMQRRYPDMPPARRY